MPKLNLEDTIAALSTPPGEGGIAVIRMSGREAIPLAEHFFRSSKNRKLSEAPSHTIHHGFLVDEKQDLADEVLVSLFRTPHSYTGEDVVEISCHGGMRNVRRILEQLIRQGARPAEPGEFTQRAFLHGKIDLTQAEAVLDLIQAGSERALETAVRQLQGNLSKKINQLKDSLVKICAHFEASLDFPDDDLEVYSEEEFLRRLDGVERELKTLLATFKRGLGMREGILTIIVGRPNVGKSSLLNSLLAKDRALVSEIPGTTRDALEEPLEIAGVSLRLVDTAGLGLAPTDELDQMARERTRRYLQEGALFLFLIDGSQEWTSEDEAVFLELNKKNYLPVVNKIDLPLQIGLERLLAKIPDEKPCFISCVTGEGLLELEKRVEEKILKTGVPQESLILTRLRHKQAIEKSLEFLEQSRKTLQEKRSAEFVLEELKAGIDSLRELVGEIYSEDLLDVIFQEFCIGK